MEESEFQKKIKFAFFSPEKFIKKYLKIFFDFIFPRNFRPFRVGKFYLNEKSKFDREMIGRENPRVLVLVNHYYSKKNVSDFPGKCAKQDKEIRKSIVEKVLNELKRIPNVDVKICGIKGCSIFEIDQDFSHIQNPAFLVYSSIEWMFSQVDQYDYFVNIEDDIFLTKETFDEIVQFDKSHSVDECYHPNRMECDENGVEYCPDFKARSGWENISMKYKGHKLKVAKNSHSGLAIFSRPKMIFAKNKVNLKRREIIIGYYMASAFANVNAPFLLYRNFSNLSKHKVIHLDNWEER